MKIIYELTKEEYNDIKENECYGCEILQQYIKELIIENYESILDADLELKVL